MAGREQRLEVTGLQLDLISIGGFVTHGRVVPPIARLARIHVRKESSES
jgi:hypothetical protein